MNTFEIIILIVILGIFISCLTFILGWWLGMIRTNEEYFFVALGLSKETYKDTLNERNSESLKNILDKRYKKHLVADDEYRFYNNYINKLEKNWKEEDDRNRKVAELN